MSTRRIAAAGQSRPESGLGAASLPRARRAASRARQRNGRPPRHASRPGFSPPLRLARPQPRNWARANKEIDLGWEVVDDFPDHLPVLPGELKVIETYLAQLLDETLKPGALETSSSAGDTVERDVE
jgi:hypothetical protein